MDRRLPWRELDDGGPLVRRGRDAWKSLARCVGNASVRDEGVRRRVRRAEPQEMRVRAVVDVSRMGRERQAVIRRARRTRLVARTGDKRCGGTVRVMHVRDEPFEGHRENAQQCGERRHSAAHETLESQ